MNILRVFAGIVCLLLLCAGPLHASVFVGFNPNATTTAYIEYDPSTFSFVGSATVTSTSGGQAGPITGFAFDSNGNLNIGIETSPGLSVIETWDVSTNTLLGTSNPVAGLAALTLQPDPATGGPGPGGGSDGVIPEPASFFVWAVLAAAFAVGRWGHRRKQL